MISCVTFQMKTSRNYPHIFDLIVYYAGREIDRIPLDGDEDNTLQKIDGLVAKLGGPKSTSLSIRDGNDSATATILYETSQFVGVGEGRAYEARVHAYANAMQSMLKENPISSLPHEAIQRMFSNVETVVLFDYVMSPEMAKKIAMSRVLIPGTDDLADPRGYILHRPYVEFTDARPEEGKEIISNAIGMPQQVINYGLELMTIKEWLKNAKEHLPRTHQVESDFPVPVKVLRIWDMRKIARGVPVHRYTSESGVPYSCYITK